MKKQAVLEAVADALRYLPKSVWDEAKTLRATKKFHAQRWFTTGGGHVAHYGRVERMDTGPNKGRLYFVSCYHPMMSLTSRPALSSVPKCRKCANSKRSNERYAKRKRSKR